LVFRRFCTKFLGDFELNSNRAAELTTTWKMSLFAIDLCFPNEESCWRFLERVRWPDGKTCPKCGSVEDAVPWTPRPHHWHCRYCGARFHAALGTLIAGSHLPLRIWFAAILLLSAEPGLSSVALGRNLGIRQKTAWSLAIRVRRMASENPRLIQTIAEAAGAQNARRLQRHRAR
jgi:hypothetical protein